MTDQKVLENHIKQHYKNLFNKNHIKHDTNLISSVILLIVNDRTNEILTMLPTVEEIHSVILNLNPNYAPGPNGFGEFSSFTIGIS